jgi:murein DD-endopeptidase MepM/ murein hydrolase activator NlpD
MRQHAHPIRRSSQRRRHIGATAVGAALVLLVTAGLAGRLPSGSSPTGLAAGPNQVAAQEPASPSAVASTGAGASPSPSPSRTPQPTPPATSADDPGTTAASTRLYPARIALDAWPPVTPKPISQLTGYVWPIAHPRLTLPFGPTLWGSRVVDGKLFHDGIDLATFCNDRILAAHAGVVLAAGRQFDNFLGWVGDLSAYYHRLDVHHLWPDLPIVVVIDDGNTYRSVYAHMWKLTVHAGQRVRAGQLIGYEGMTGRATGCHLHYSIFSPYQTATFGIQAKVAKDMRLPRLEIARIDPLLVLPYRRGISGSAKNLGGH